MTEVKLPDDIVQLENDIELINNSKEFIDKYAPKTLDGLIFPSKIKNMIREWITLKEGDSIKILKMPNLMLIGQQGTGKSTLANIITNEIGVEPLFINASSESGIDVVRDKLTNFVMHNDINSVLFTNIDKKIVILDEFDSFSEAGQKALRGFIEEYKTSVRFIATLNYPDKILAPIRSRFAQGTIDFSKEYHEGKDDVVKQLISHIDMICKSEGIEYTTDVIFDAIKNHYPDIRSIISVLNSQYIKQGNLTERGVNIDSDELISIIKSGNINKMHAYARDNHIYNKVFVDLRNYMVQSENWEGVIAIADRAEIINTSVDKTISMLALFHDLSKLI